MAAERNSTPLSENKISRRALVGLAASAATAGACAMAATGAAEPDLADLPDSELWPHAMQLAQDLSKILDRLSDNGSLAVSVYGGKSGTARVKFREAEPFNDARALVKYYQKMLVASVEAIEGTELDWLGVGAVDEDANALRFCLTAFQRKAAA